MMNRQHDRTGTGRLNGLSIFFFLFSLTPAASAATSYLQELEAEAAATEEAANGTAGSEQEWPNQSPAVIGENLASGLSKARFEEALKARFYGSYLFYSTLEDTKQGVVYGEYKKNSDIKHIRQVIQSQMTK